MQRVIDVVDRLEVWAVRPESTIHEAARLMAEKNIGALAVINEYGQLIGIITERDLIQRVLVLGNDPQKIPVAQVMTREVEVIDKDDSTVHALEKMTRRQCRHLPVMDGDQAIAMLSAKDLLRAALRHREQTMARLMNDLRADRGVTVRMTWRCQLCGFTHPEIHPLENCPECQAEGSFMLVEIDLEPEE